MKLAVVGAGGVGGYYGALLAAAGNEVHFVARGPHLQAMRAAGLQVKSVLGDLLIRPVRATDQPAKIGRVDLALFCTKAFSTQSAALQSKPLVGDDTAVLSLQNGVEGADVLAAIFGAGHVLAGATWLSSFRRSPGIIQHVSDSRRIVLGELDGRDSTRIRAVHRLFSEAGVAVEISNNIQGVLWAKLIFISAVAGIGSLTRLPIAVYRGVPEARHLLEAMMRETSAVAHSLGIRLDPDAVDQALQYVDAALPEIKASMQLDVEAGRPSELEALIGVIVGAGQERGVPTPVASTVYGLLLPLERQAR